MARRASSLPAMPGPMTNSCCLLKKKSGEGYFKKGQGVLLRFVSSGDEPFVRIDASFALLTCHHLIPSKEAVNGWKVVFGEDSFLELDKSMVSHFLTCCGDDGILGKEQHVDKTGVCPFHLDFSLILLLDQVNALPPGTKLVQLCNAIDSWKMVEKLHSSKCHGLTLEIYRRVEWEHRSMTRVIYESYKERDVVWPDSKLSWFHIPCKKGTQIAKGASGSPGYVMRNIFGMRTEKMSVSCEPKPYDSSSARPRTVLACTNVSSIIKLCQNSLLKKKQKKQQFEHDPCIKVASSIIKDSVLSNGKLSATAISVDTSYEHLIFKPKEKWPESPESISILTPLGAKITTIEKYRDK